MRPLPTFRLALLTVLLVVLAGCTVGPNYKRPSTPGVAPPAFKEQPPVNFKEAEAAGWKQSQPGDAYAKGRWWELYNDPALNALEEQVAVSNQNVLQAEAQFREAKAAVSVARAALFPTVSAGPSISANGGGPQSTAASGNSLGISGASAPASTVRTAFNLPINVAWEPDLWGNIRRGVTASAATAQAQAANVANARLLYQAELAQDYFGLHGIDSETTLLKTTEASYQEYLTLTQNRFNAGIASDLDIAQAQTQLYGVQSQLMDLQVQRTAFEHAIAILIGKAPAELTLPEGSLKDVPPAVPVGVPSELLQRRPDIAMAERQVAAANEQIGISMAAFYPTLSLTASGGFESTSLTKWFTWPSRVWSVGPQLAETLFDAGRRRGVVREQQAAYDATVAGYRQTVLTAMQQVEDNLAALRILAGEADTIQQTVEAANRSLDISTAQYKAGTANYLTVITAQAAALSAQVNAVTLLARRYTASAVLIEALGGGWNSSELPTKQEVAVSR